MPLPLPNLDDRKFDDLLSEARAMIPAHAPEWTNHNESDPGITLVELFAYLTEMFLYRVNRVTGANKLAFLRLMNGPRWHPDTSKTVNDLVRDTVLRLREQTRAVTCQDFEKLTLKVEQVARAHCLPRRDLDAENALLAQEKPGHVTVVIVPLIASPTAALKQRVLDTLEPARLLTTQLHVVYPHYVTLAIHLTVALKPGTRAQGLPFPIAATDKDAVQSNLDQGKIAAALSDAFQHAKTPLSGRTDVQIQQPGSRWQLTDYSSIAIYAIRSEQTRVNIYVRPAGTDGSHDTLLFPIDPSIQDTAVSNLNNARAAPELQSAFDKAGSALSDNLQVVIEQAGSRWLLIDRPPLKSYTVLNEDNQLNVYGDLARSRVIQALKDFLDPLTGGPDGEGWPFGRDLFVSDIYNLLETLPEVDYVTRTGTPPPDEFAARASGDGWRRNPQGAGRLIGLTLTANELIDAQNTTFDVTVIAT